MQAKIPPIKKYNPKPAGEMYVIPVSITGDTIIIDCICFFCSSGSPNVDNQPCKA